MDGKLSKVLNIREPDIKCLVRCHDICWILFLCWI